MSRRGVVCRTKLVGAWLRGARIAGRGSALHSQDELGRQMRRQHVEKRKLVVAQDGIAAQPDVGHMGVKQVPHRARYEIVVLRRANGHRCGDANAEPDAHVGFDDVGVCAFENDVGCDARLLEAVVDPPTGAVAVEIGDQRVRGNRFQGERLLLGERVVGAYHHDVLPAIRRQKQEVA